MKSIAIALLLAASPFFVDAWSSDPVPTVKIAPEYPASAREVGIVGYVVCTFTISRDGSVIDIAVTESEPLGVFDETAVAALKKWKYKPVVVDGKRVRKPEVRQKFLFGLVEVQKESYFEKNSQW